ncbi:MAG: hypothetical protein AAF411_29240 [Myxococcota bacterium]
MVVPLNGVSGGEAVVALVFMAPAFVGLASLLIGWRLLTTRDEHEGSWRLAVGVILLILGLGIGGCYGISLLGVMF